MNEQQVETLTSAAHKWVTLSTDDWSAQYIPQEVQTWKDLCTQVGVEYGSPEFRAAALVMFAWLIELLSSERENSIELPMVQPTIRAVITSLIMGVFGDDILTKEVK